VAQAQVDFNDSARVEVFGRHSPNDCGRSQLSHRVSLRHPNVSVQLQADSQMQPTPVQQPESPVQLDRQLLHAAVPIALPP